MKKPGNRCINIFAILVVVSLFGCAKKVDDPLKYTKKLVREGHGSLYNNGAFKVPRTSIHLIPPGPGTIELAEELAGIRAKEAFLLSLKNAADSVDIVVEGSKYSYELAKKIRKQTGKSAGAIRNEVGGRGTILVSKSYSAGKDIAVRSWEFSKEKIKDLNRLARHTVDSFGERGRRVSGGIGKAGDSLTEGSGRLGDAISEGSIRIGDEISDGSIRAGKELVKGPIRTGKRIIRGSIEKGDEIAEGSIRKGDEIAEGSLIKGRKIIDEYRESGEKLTGRSVKSAKNIYSGGKKRSKRAISYGYEQFVQGYAALPSKIKKRGIGIGESIKDLDMLSIAREEWERTRKLSKAPGELVVETISSYTDSAAEPFIKAGAEISKGYKTSSLSFSILKSLGLVLKGLFCDATIEPVARITAGSLGYIGVNMLAFPVMVVAREGIETVEVAAEVTWDTARTAYDIVAPTPIAVVAGIYSLVDFTSSAIAAGAAGTIGPAAGFAEKRIGEAAGVTVMGAGQVAGAAVKGGGQVAGATVKGGGTVAGAAVTAGGAVAGTVAGVGVMGAGQVAGVAAKGVGQGAGLAVKGAGKLAGLTVKGAGHVAGLTVKGAGYAGAGLQYIGIPVAAAGITVAGGSFGTAIGTTGGITGGTVRVAGETGAAATQVFGNLIAGTALAGGAVISTAGGAAVGAYELSKAIIVPAGYELGSGIVLSYGTLAHLGAHSILAVADASYMVLSLEGPRWVVYAIKGKLDDGEDLPAGTVLDLKKMHEAGEELYYLPLSDEEMSNVVNSVYENLPESEK